jgi:uncharacterized protein (TIGR02246 family)
VRAPFLFGMVLFSVGLVVSCRAPAQERASDDRAAAEILALERSALDRFNAADPQGYLDLYAEDVSYFDPQTDRRLDGRRAMEERLAPVKDVKRPFTDPRYEMSNPKVVVHGDMALLTFNLVNYGKLPGQSAESVVSRWNSSEVYKRTGGRWRILHSHWSFVKPVVAPPGS